MQVGERAQERCKIYKRAKEDKTTLIRMAKFNCSCFCCIHVNRAVNFSLCIESITKTDQYQVINLLGL